MYKVIIEKGFKDLEDNDYIYKVNDIYPREGLKPTKKRIKELASIKNKIGKVLIEEIVESEEDLEVETEVENVEEVKNAENVETSEEIMIEEHKRMLEDDERDIEIQKKIAYEEINEEK